MRLFRNRADKSERTFKRRNGFGIQIGNRWYANKKKIR